jgi:hypothetical protein
MKIRQYTYFGIRSGQVHPDEITARLGLVPDRVALRGSRVEDPPRPKAHLWVVGCDAPGLTVTEQLEQVIARVNVKREAIRELIESSDETAAWLQVVRHFEADDGDAEGVPVAGDVEERSGQHQLLGWHLSAEALDFVREVHAEIDIDEYG